MKTYKVSMQLDVEVDYFVTKIDNARYDAQFDNDMERLDVLEAEFQKLLELQQNMVLKNGIFEVSGKYYDLAVHCRETYRYNH